MNTFTWLFIGHLIGDWLLQNDWMARGKRRGFLTWPGTIHFTVYTMTLMSTLHLSDPPTQGWGFVLSLGIFIYISHWLTDATNIVTWWMRFYHQTEMELIRVMIDQTLHLLVLALITVLFFNE